MEADTQTTENVPEVIEIDTSVAHHADTAGLKDVVAAVNGSVTGVTVAIRRPAYVGRSESDSCADEEITLP